MEFHACELTGGQWGSGAWFTALPGNTPPNALTANTTYSMDCFDTTGASTGRQKATVMVTAPLGPCNDIPAQTTVPNGCVTPTPPPGTCTPTGGSYSVSSNTCSCPAGQHLSESACVANPPPPLCSNGLNNSYAPSCTCPAGQYQPFGSASCVVLPVCANGLSQSYSPSCTCESGQVQSGSTCVLAGVINTLTANPIRVLKGNKVTITWSTSNMADCTLSRLNISGNSNVASALSSSINPVINSKTIYTLSCTDQAGIAYSSSVTVNLIPQTIER